MNNHGNRQKHLSSNRVQQFLLHRFHQEIARLIRQSGQTFLLDVGCGEGFVLKYVSHQFPELRAIGGDFNWESLQWGRRQISLDIPLSTFDIHALPFPDHHFPLVMCLEVLEHLPDSVVGLRELSRVSSDYILLSVPHEPFFRGANFLRGKHLTALGNDPEHLHNYSDRAFSRMVEQVIDIVWHGYRFPWQIVLGRKRR